MKRLLRCLTVAVCSWLALHSVASACDTAATATPASTCVVMKHLDTPGVWFELKTADELRRFKLEIPELRLQLDAFTQRVAIRDEQLKLYTEVITLKDSALGVANDSMAAFARTAREAQEDERKARAELDAWYRSPIIPFLAGVATVTTVVLLAK